jgi:phage terminase large subunit
MDSSEKDENWISSKDVLKVAEIKSCDLMHYRIQGKLEFKKRGNAFLYSKDSVENLHLLLEFKKL